MKSEVQQSTQQILGSPAQEGIQSEFGPTGMSFRSEVRVNFGAEQGMEQGAEQGAE